MTFQSRFGKDPWIGPETIEVAQQMARAGVQLLAIISPSFTMDCIETLYELETEVKEAFLKAGGKECKVVTSLNSSPTWVDTIKLLLAVPAALDLLPADSLVES